MADPNPAGGSVLIVEQDESTRQMIATVLRRAGFAVRCVATCDEAETELHDQSVEAVVRDVNVTPRNRELVVQELERIAPEILERTVVTSTTPAELSKHAPLAQPFAVICKPFEVDILVDAVRRCCEAWRQRHARAVRRSRQAQRENPDPTIDVDRVGRFLRSVPKVQEMLTGDAASLHEAMLRTELRRTASELARVLREAAKCERYRMNAAALRLAAIAAARLAGRRSEPWPTDARRDH